jgi:hypothetical protein
MTGRQAHALPSSAAHAIASCAVTEMRDASAA